ncbi:acyl-CoA N-acyltransferase [Lophiotrema nucula]|uniref:Acyl-CoA N-acyltransferase n=1 Tax=Lophiotrema nucula TaxID=690887 RepID=A0A6A5ZMC8_9PLEO|nr:acyl-CoA N-acyltransferase [Lophiotrema nucula]
MATPTATPASENATSKSDINIRLATVEDLPYLVEIETACDQLFRDIDMHAIADADLPTVEQYRDCQEQKYVWVAVLATAGDDKKPVAYVQIDKFENDKALKSVYIHQISVHPSHARRGIGRQLMEFLETESKQQGRFQALDLTTFDEVPWNRKYYQRLGFAVLSEEELARDECKDIRQQLQREKDDEVLGQWKRVAMRKRTNV